MKKLPRDTGRLGSLALFDKLERSRSTDAPLHDPRRIEDVLADVRGWLEQVLATPTTLRGYWTQGLFAAVIAAIGRVRMIQELDNGDMWFSEPPKHGLSLPDFLVVTESGDRLVIEVKSVDRLKVWDRFGLRAKDVARLRSYAELLDASPYLATFWDGFGWTLVHLDHLADTAGRAVKLGYGQMFKLSDMGLLGDMLLATVPPLEFIIEADLEGSTPVVDDEAILKFGAIDMFAAGKRIVDADERGLALFLMMYGDWPENEHVTVDEDRMVRRIGYRFEPVQDDHPEQLFKMVGSLSSMATRIYRHETRLDDDSIAKVSTELEPGMFTDLLSGARKGDALRLWRFILRSNTD